MIGAPPKERSGSAYAIHSTGYKLIVVGLTRVINTQHPDRTARRSEIYLNLPQAVMALSDTNAAASGSNLRIVPCYKPTPVAPKITAISRSTAAADYATILEAHRRSPLRGCSPPMHISSTPEQHVLRVELPGFAPEMVTISAKRCETIAVIADMWHAEQNCHHEWSVKFSPRDVNMSTVRAHFSPAGTLTIHVSRQSGRYEWV
ncbi:hypothetical protein BD410DRAFT_784775 [Rickenella mellea]|uniref:SHSP domain-containing protein n=1 Tax=Rickenella mellea TaxID=50990 RepID=A0A4Y7QEG1_9AGAM|nr:hypothetical protein BD410DRAFT_784775 [Rickenella mellea]